MFGEARGNRGLAGIGIVVLDPSGKERTRRAEFLGLATPAQAEFRAIVEGIRMTADLEGPAIIVTAHETPFRQVTGRSSAHGPDISELYVEAIEHLSADDSLEIQLVDEMEVDTARRLAAVAIETRGRRSAID